MKNRLIHRLSFSEKGLIQHRLSMPMRAEKAVFCRLQRLKERCSEFQFDKPFLFRF